MEATILICRGWQTSYFKGKKEYIFQACRLKASVTAMQLGHNNIKGTQRIHKWMSKAKY